MAPDARIHREVALAQPRAVVVAPEADRHRGHRLGQDELAHLSDDRLAVLVERLDLGAQRPRLQLALVDGQGRHAADEGGAQVGPAAGREQPRVRADVLVDPVEALGRQRRPGGADGPQRTEVAALARLDTRLHARRDVRRARAERRHAGGLGEVPQHAEVGRARVAVVEDDRRRCEQHADQEVPHHPAGGGEPEEPVALLRVEVQVDLLEVLEQDPALAVDDRLGQPGGARSCRAPTAGGRREPARRSAARRGRRAPPATRCRRGSRSARPSRRSPARCRRRSRCGRGRARRSGSRRRRGAPWARSARSGRPPTARRTRAPRSTTRRRSRPWPGRPRSSRGCWACRRPRCRRDRRPCAAARRRCGRSARAARPTSTARARAARRRGGWRPRRRRARGRSARRRTAATPGTTARPASRAGRGRARRARRPGRRRTPRSRPRSPRGRRPTSATARRSRPRARPRARSGRSSRARRGRRAGATAAWAPWTVRVDGSPTPLRSGRNAL